jgi:hypothetical protein
MADIKRKASLRSGAEQMFEKLSNDKAPDSSAIAQDYMYHLGVASNDERLAIFKDTKFVCMMGSNDRAHTFAKALAAGLDMKFKVSSYIKTAPGFCHYIIFAT